MQTLIELFDEHPIHNVLGTETFLPEQTLFLCQSWVGNDMQEKLRKYFEERGCSSRILFLPVNLLDAEAVAKKLREAVSTYPDCAVDIAGGTDAALFAAGAVCSELDVPAFTYSRKRNTFYEISNAPYARSRVCDVHLRVSDAFLMAGGSMLKGRMDNNALEAFRDMTDPFFEMYMDARREWQHFISYMQTVSADRETLEVHAPIRPKGRHGLMDCPEDLLRKCGKIGLIEKLRMTEKTVSFAFPSDLARFALRDVGSVLEMYVYKACRDAGVFDDVCLSAIVNWDGDRVHADSVTNEIDVACTRGVMPLFISCKTCAIRTEALNELAILRDRFGSPTARALVVTSARAGSERRAMRHRAAELNIDVLEQGDLKREDLIRSLRDMSRIKDRVEREAQNHV